MKRENSKERWYGKNVVVCERKERERIGGWVFNNAGRDGDVQAIWK